MSRILYFSRDYTTHDHRFLSALAQTEHQVGFIQLERKDQVEDERPLPSEIEALPWAGGQLTAGIRDSWRLLRSLRDVIRDFNPDLIQAGPVQRSAFLAVLSGFRPVVSMSWGYDLLIDAERNPLWRWATRYTLKHSAALVSDCETIRQRAIQYGMPPERIVTFPWGANIRRYHPGDSDIRERLGWQDDTFVLLSVRSLAPIYGVTDLAKAFVKAANSYPHLRLLMLGSGPQAGEIRQILQRGGVMEKVHFPGQVSQAQLPEYYRAADLYISTSFSDGTSISLLEALASGLPVLVSDIPGNQEWVTPGENGWLYPAGDADALAGQIVQVLEKRGQLAEIRSTNRQLAEERADWKKNFPQLFQAYEIALNG